MNANLQRNAAQGAAQYQVADLLIDVGLQRVTRAGAEISLPKLSFDLLLVLIRAAPNVVSNDELMAQVWPGIVVSPETVSQRVKLLRDALGDDPHNPRYIAGLRGRGYRLLASARAAEALPAVDLPRASGRSYRAAILGALSVVALLVAGAFVAILLRSQQGPSPEEKTVTLVGLPPRTVAVLPFENLSPDPANEYLALGMAEMVLNRLANVREIVVIARSSSFMFRDANADARAIGNKLGARYLVEGSVQREGEKLRVTARLIDAENDSQVESLHFDRGLADIFNIQDEIADQIAGALEASVTGAVALHARTPRSENLDAWLAYLQGRTHLETWSATDADEAAKHFERAITLDPRFAAAYVGLADAQMQALQRRSVDPEGDEAAPTIRRIAPLIEKAIALDPSLGAAYIARASVRAAKDVAGIEADLRKGIELDPANSRGLASFYEFLSEVHRTEEARGVLDRALLVDPLSARAHYLKALDFTNTSMEFEQALLDVLKIDPKFTSALTRLGEMRWKNHGEFAEGVKLVERAIAIDPESAWIRHAAYLMYLDVGDLAAARDVSEPFAGSSGSARFQMLQYAGDLRAAGEAAFQAPEWLHGYFSNWNDGEAVRDLALMTRDYRRAIRFIESDYDFGEPRQVTVLSAHRAVPLAHLLKQSGQRTASSRLLDDLLAWLDSKERKPKAWEPGTRRIRANVLALQGERDTALAELAEAFRSGDRRLWWYTIEHDPLYADMRSDPRFQTIAAEARAHAARQRTLLEEMRRKGEAPLRPSSTPRGP